MTPRRTRLLLLAPQLARMVRQSLIMLCSAAAALSCFGCESFLRQQAACEQVRVAFCEMREHCGGVDAASCRRALGTRIDCGNVDVNDASACVGALNELLATECTEIPADLGCSPVLWAVSGETCITASECGPSLLCRDTGNCVTPDQFCQPNATLARDGVTCACDFATDANGGCSEPPFQCGEHAHADVSTNTCLCDAGFVPTGGSDCAEDREGYCNEVGTTGASYCNPDAEACPCGSGFGQGYLIPDGSGACCCNAGTTATGDGQCG